MKLVLFYQAIVSPLPIFFVWQYILLKIYSLFCPHISLERRHCILCPLEFYLPIDGLHAFCRNYLTTSLPIYDVNKKYPTYIPVISHRCCCSKLVGAFLIKIYSLFCPHISLERRHYIPYPLEFYLPIDGLHTFRRNYLTTSLPTYDVNEKYPTYMPVISHRCCCSKLVGAFRDVAHHGVSYCQRAFMGSMHFVAITLQLPYLLMT